MTRRLDADPELLGLVRRADPMLDPRVQAEAGLDTDPALRRLAPELDRPAASRRARRRRRSALRIAVLIGAVAAATVVVANVASTGNGSAVSPAQARTMIMRARAALLHPKGAILEQDVRTTVIARGGSTSRSEAHQSLSTSPPVRQPPDHDPERQAAVGASDYQPLQSEDRRDCRSGVGIVRYPIERVLTGPAASPRLLSLQARHPSAAVDRSSAGYQAVLWRLFHERLPPARPA